jgi:predicted MFS family arabinose efflux permease
MTDATRPLTSRLITLMAVAIGIIVSNLYYLQPLLHQISHDFRVGITRATLLMTLVQAGYAVGLAFVVPLGDVIARRRLAVGIFVLSSATMVLAATWHSFTVLTVLTLVIGLTSVGGQVLIPLAADLAEESQRGRVIARVMSGLLIGILLSRTFSGLVAQWAGWRAVYYIAAGALAVMAALLWANIPPEEGRPKVAYRRLIGGVFSLYVTEPILRRRAYFGAMIFACNNVLWTTLSYLLAGSPFHYANAVIGLFGLFGVAGVMAANAAGHQADRRRQPRATIIFAAVLLFSFGLLALGRDDVVVLALGIMLLDTGMQGTQITNQSVIYGLVPGARSRINSAYMVAGFTGASLGSFLSGQAYAHFGWYGNCALGAILAAGLAVPAVLWRQSAAPRPLRAVAGAD